jgi:hypothetical protein
MLTDTLRMASLLFGRTPLSVSHQIGPSSAPRRMRGPGQRTVVPQGIAAFMVPYIPTKGAGPRDAGTYRFARRNSAKVLYRAARS